MKFFSHGSTRVKLAVAGTTACAVGALVLPAASAAPAPSSTATQAAVASSAVSAKAAAPGSIDSRVRGTFGRNGTVRGTFVPDRFFVRKGESYANGVLRAKLRRGNGELVGTVTRRVSIPVRTGSVPTLGRAGNAVGTAAGAECDVLNLVLGPLDLNLLGLEVRLNRVVLDIVAVPGAGNLLGNLLCAVAGLLDGTGLLNELRLSNLLNRVLAVLRLG